MENQIYFKIFETPDGKVNFNRLKDSNSGETPIKEETTIKNGLRMTVVSYENFLALFGGKLDGTYSNNQLYYDKNGNIALDSEWEYALMSTQSIKKKHLKRLMDSLDEELLKDSPDVIVAAKLTRDIFKLPTLSQKEIFKIALDSLRYADSPKTIIREKLKAKIDELESTESK